MIENIVFLAADTLRSRAYAQALCAAGHTLREALLVTSQRQLKWGQAEGVSSTCRDFGPIFVPDLSIPLADTLAQLCETTRTLDTGTVNDPQAVDWLQLSGARMAVFSGFGGEIVKRPLLGAGPTLLHMHSGWLPDYRGSTTIYYSYLREGSCGVTAIGLGETIDTGPIFARKRYPSPPVGADVDYEYDSAIRADLLVELVGKWTANGSLDEPIEQTADAGRTYYIIHPVLRHVARNRIQRSAAGT
jgi:methionyl-tRNA formyltransferase